MPDSWEEREQELKRRTGLTPEERAAEDAIKETERHKRSIAFSQETLRLIGLYMTARINLDMHLADNPEVRSALSTLVFTN